MTLEQEARFQNIIDGMPMQFVNGLLFGGGFLTAVVIFRVLFHVNIC